MSLRLKRVLTHILCFVLGAVIGAGIYGAVDNIPKKDVSGEFMTESSGGGLVISDTEANGIKLTSVAIPVAQYADYGISPIAENAQIITATVSPVGLSVEWSAAWENSSSSWAQGKQVGSYIKLTPGGENNKTLTVECLQAFGEKIIVTCKLVDDPAIQAMVDVHYMPRVIDLQFAVGNILAGDCELNGSFVSRSVDIEFKTPEPERHHSDNGGNLYVSPSKTVGTLPVTETITLKLKDRAFYVSEDLGSRHERYYLSYGTYSGDTPDRLLGTFTPAPLNITMHDREELYFDTIFFTRRFNMTLYSAYGPLRSIQDWALSFPEYESYGAVVGDPSDLAVAVALAENKELCTLEISYKNEEFNKEVAKYEIIFNLTGVEEADWW